MTNPTSSDKQNRTEESVADLIARLEAAEAGSQELDAYILASIVDGTVEQSPINGRWCVYVGDDRRGNPRLWEPHNNAKDKALWRAYSGGLSTSIDAALLLVPEGWFLDRINQYHDTGRPLGWWGVHLRHSPPWERGVIVGEHKGALALALCIAALKARQP